MTDLIIIDDHKMIRKGLKAFLSETKEFSEFYEAENIDEAKKIISKFTGTKTAIAIVDLQLGNESGYEILDYVKSNNFFVKCLVYSMFDSAGYAMEATSRGAYGYVTKSADDSELLQALKTIKNGGTYIQQTMIYNISVTANLLKGLTKKELLVYDLIHAKYSNQEIAEKLNISLRTTENYVSKIYDKLGVNSREELIINSMK